MKWKLCRGLEFCNISKVFFLSLLVASARRLNVIILCNSFVYFVGDVVVEDIFPGLSLVMQEESNVRCVDPNQTICKELRGGDVVFGFDGEPGRLEGEERV
jgi:hypothetical protein